MVVLQKNTMKPAISADLKIADLLSHYPAAKEVFLLHGLGSLVSEDGMRALAPFLTVATALRSRFIAEAPFLDELAKACEKELLIDAPALASLDSQGELTLLALMPCGLKMPFSRAITSFFAKARDEFGVKARFAVEGNLNQELSYYSYVEKIETLDELPDIIISADFNTFYGQSFYERFVANGLMRGYGNFAINPSYTAAGIVDPSQRYSILGVNPLVMVANLDAVGERPLPRNWGDLLDPIWKKSVTLRGGNGFFCHAVLLPTYQQYGSKGLKQLGDNVMQGLHPAQMIKNIDGGAPGALYVMPEFFAHRAKRQDRLRILWPEDGALASPVTLQVKAAKIEELRPVLDYLTGRELARILVDARFPVPHGELAGAVQDKPLSWLGWDYLRRDDLLKVNQEIDRIFMPRVATAL